MSEQTELKRYHLEIGIDRNGYEEAKAVLHAGGWYCESADALAIAAERDQLQAELATAKARIAELNQYIIKIEKIAGDNAFNLGISMSNADRLEAQLACTWQPVANGELDINHQMYKCDISVSDNEITRTSTWNRENIVTIVLPDELRVCRL